MSSTPINNIQKILGLGAAVSLGAAVLPVTSIAAPEGAPLDQTQAQIAQSPACRAVDADPGLNIRSQPGGEIIGSVENNNLIALQNPNPQGQDWVEIQAPMNGYVAAAYLNYCSEAAAQQQPIARVDQQGTMSQQPAQTQPVQMNQPGQMNQPAQTQPGQMNQPAQMNQPMNQPGQMNQPMNQPAQMNQPGQMNQPMNQSGQMNQPDQMNQPGQTQESRTQTEGESCRAISSDDGLNVRSQPEVESEVITTLPDDTQVQIQNSGEDGWVPISEPIQGYVAAENLIMCGQ
ncbi:SH3 domain-containing protein [Laspinema olomoucense]|uniref:SH3 domain-containing protein n=1 Tax=Laspinema olomoucense D3b TaxID=2953688 RepID=A0ABT2N846_9CYAN|nr:SH3 domain-containing protein [Laspinema sp. D3b]MCT7978852.1 SH3 domain-containing protein [Laspinema sp. D3b]